LNRERKLIFRTFGPLEKYRNKWAYNRGNMIPRNERPEIINVFIFEKLENFENVRKYCISMKCEWKRTALKKTDRTARMMGY
jgi:hypothetical protein